MSENHTSGAAAATQLASVVGLQAGWMGGILGCCTGLAILMTGFILGLFLFWRTEVRSDKAFLRAEPTPSGTPRTYFPEQWQKHE